MKAELERIAKMIETNMEVLIWIQIGKFYLGLKSGKQREICVPNLLWKKVSVLRLTAGENTFSINIDDKEYIFSIKKIKMIEMNF